MDRYEQLINAQYTMIAALSLGQTVESCFEGEAPSIPLEIKEAALGLAINGLFGIPYKGEA